VAVDILAAVEELGEGDPPCCSEFGWVQSRLPESVGCFEPPQVTSNVDLFPPLAQVVEVTRQLAQVLAVLFDLSRLGGTSRLISSFSSRSHASRSVSSPSHCPPGKTMLSRSPTNTGVAVSFEARALDHEHFGWPLDGLPQDESHTGLDDPWAVAVGLRGRPFDFAEESSDNRFRQAIHRMKDNKGSVHKKGALHAGSTSFFLSGLETRD
jgi:hypothetical protein